MRGARYKLVRERRSKVFGPKLSVDPNECAAVNVWHPPCPERGLQAFVACYMSFM